MAKKSTFRQIKKKLKKYNFPQSYAGFILGAIVVITMGLLVANFLTRNSDTGGRIDGAIKTTAEEQNQIAQANEFKREYKVKEGDSLSLIAQRAYGDPNMWNVLAVKNEIVYPNLIYANTNLEVPPKAEADQIMKDLSATSYQVQEGDTLFKISQRVYADGWNWPVLAKANNVGYLPNGNPLIFAGSTLAIPR